jgi:hypothetical protein
MLWLILVPLAACLLWMALGACKSGSDDDDRNGLG